MNRCSCLAVVFCVCFQLNVCSQNPKVALNHQLRIKVFPQDVSYREVFQLYDLTDTAVTYIPFIRMKNREIDHPASLPMKYLPVNRLGKLKIRNANRLRTVLISIASGFLVGELIGLAAFKDSDECLTFGACGILTRGDKALLLASVTGGISGWIGIAATSARKYRIDGDPEKYNDRRKSMDRFRVKPYLEP